MQKYTVKLSVLELFTANWGREGWRGTALCNLLRNKHPTLRSTLGGRRLMQGKTETRIVLQKLRKVLKSRQKTAERERERESLRKVCVCVRDKTDRNTSQTGVCVCVCESYI